MKNENPTYEEYAKYFFETTGLDPMSREDYEAMLTKPPQTEVGMKSK